MLACSPTHALPPSPPAEIQPIQPYQPPKSSNPTVASAQDIAAAVAAGDIDGAAQMIAKASAGGQGFFMLRGSLEGKQHRLQRLAAIVKLHYRAVPCPFPTLPQAEVIAAATSLTATAGTTSAFAQAASLAVTNCG